MRDALGRTVAEVLAEDLMELEVALEIAEGELESLYFEGDQEEIDLHEGDINDSIEWIRNELDKLMGRSYFKEDGTPVIVKDYEDDNAYTKFKYLGLV